LLRDFKTMALEHSGEGRPFEVIQMDGGQEGPPPSQQSRHPAASIGIVDDPQAARLEQFTDSTHDAGRIRRVLDDIPKRHHVERPWRILVIEKLTGTDDHTVVTRSPLGHPAVRLAALDLPATRFGSSEKRPGGG